MKREYILIVLLCILLLVAAGCDVFLKDKEEVLLASGVVEVVEVSVSSELGGQVVEILANKGDLVRDGQALIRFDDSLLLTQLNQAKAGLTQAEANYDLVTTGPSPEQREVWISAAELELINAQQALEDLYDDADLMAAQALKDIAAADKSLDSAEKRLKNLMTAADTPDIDAAWASVVLAKEKLDNAKEDFEPYEKKPADNVQRAQYQSILADAQKHYDAVVTRYNNLVGTANKFEIALAEADFAFANAQLDRARIQYGRVKDGPDPDPLILAEARIAKAKANLAAAKAGPSPQEVAVARAAVDIARSNLDGIQTQIDKLILSAPIDGIMLTRLVEPGEVVAPGETVLTLGRLDDLTITVYIPEDQYGRIDLGQTAQVTVDSFPGEIFEASVIYISDRAEYTPRNVQTKEDRQTTVFAIELTVADPQAKLKPGMPVDVQFE